jgi:hypothetical protein
MQRGWLKALPPFSTSWNAQFKKQKRFRDCTVQLRVRDGKVGYRHALGMHGAGWALDHLRALYPDAKATDELFSGNHARARSRDCSKTLICASTGRASRAVRRRCVTHRFMMRCLFNPHLSTAELSMIAGTSMLSLEQYYLRHLKARTCKKRLIEAALEAK